MTETKNFEVSKQCIFCSKDFQWGQTIIIKAPAGACFCLSCIDKFEDDNKYDSYNTWIVHDFRGKETFDFK